MDYENKEKQLLRTYFQHVWVENRITFLIGVEDSVAHINLFFLVEFSYVYNTSWNTLKMSAMKTK